MSEVTRVFFVPKGTIEPHSKEALQRLGVVVEYVGATPPIDTDRNETITEFLRRCEEKIAGLVDINDTEVLDILNEIAKEMREG